jgi:hypothetical protein
LRVRIDFRDLNKITPKDEYHMATANMLIKHMFGFASKKCFYCQKVESQTNM